MQQATDQGHEPPEHAVHAVRQAPARCEQAAAGHVGHVGRAGQQAPAAGFEVHVTASCAVAPVLPRTAAATGLRSDWQVLGGSSSSLAASLLQADLLAEVPHLRMEPHASLQLLVQPPDGVPVKLTSFEAPPAVAAAAVAAAAAAAAEVE